MKIEEKRKNTSTQIVSIWVNWSFMRRCSSSLPLGFGAVITLRWYWLIKSIRVIFIRWRGSSLCFYTLSSCVSSLWVSICVRVRLMNVGWFSVSKWWASILCMQFLHPYIFRKRKRKKIFSKNYSSRSGRSSNRARDRDSIVQITTLCKREIFQKWTNGWLDKIL